MSEKSDKIGDVMKKWTLTRFITNLGDYDTKMTSWGKMDRVVRFQYDLDRMPQIKRIK